MTHGDIGRKVSDTDGGQYCPAKRYRLTGRVLMIFSEDNVWMVFDYGFSV